MPEIFELTRSVSVPLEKKDADDPKLYNENDIYKAICLLLKISEKSYDMMGGEEPMSPMVILKEIKTINCGTARRGGHSTAIAITARRNFYSSLIVSRDERLVSNSKKIFDSIPDYVGDKYRYCDFVSQNRAINFLRGMKKTYNANRYGAVFFDCSCLLSRKKIEDLYEFFAYANGTTLPFFIFTQ